MDQVELRNGCFTMLRMYRVLFMLMTATSLLPMAFGYRDPMVMIFSILTLVIGLLLHNKIKKDVNVLKEKKYLRIRNILNTIGFLLLITVSFFVIEDHLRMSVYSATISSEEGKYTTIQRCTVYKGKDICRHETKDMIKVYTIEKGTVTNIEDITKIIDKYEGV